MSAATARVLDAARDGRTMAGVLAVMLFLTVLSAAGGIGAARGATALRTALANRATVQIVVADAATRHALADRILTTLRALPVVTTATPVAAAELARLLGPWVDDAATDSELPIPAMIDIELAPRPDAMARVRAALAVAGPAVRIDGHADALAGSGTLLATLTVLAGATVTLMLGAGVAMVLLAVRSGLVAHRTTIDVMHDLGATDAQVATLFQRRIARDAGAGAAAGGLAAWSVILLLGHLASRTGSQMLDGMTLGRDGWIAVAALPFAFVALAAVVAHRAVVRALEHAA